MRRALGHCEAAVRVPLGGWVVLCAQHGRGHLYGTQAPACIRSPGQQLLFHVQSSQPGYSSFLSILSSAPAAGSLPPASHRAVPEVPMLPGLDLQVVLMMVLVPSFTGSELVPGIPSLCWCFRTGEGRGFPFPPPPWATCLPPPWGKTHLSCSTRILPLVEGSTLGQLREADDGAHLPSFQPVKKQAST